LRSIDLEERFYPGQFQCYSLRIQMWAPSWISLLAVRPLHAKHFTSEDVSTPPIAHHSHLNRTQRPTTAHLCPCPCPCPRRTASRQQMASRKY
jgi:hypothetical protein